MDQHTWEKASNYSLSKSKFSRVEEVFGFILFFFLFFFISYRMFLIHGQLLHWILFGGHHLLQLRC